MHLKNFSLVETAAQSGQYVLSPAYDLLPVNVIVPGDTEQTALTLNGKKRSLHRNDFLKFARTAGIPDAAAQKMILLVVSRKPVYLRLCEESYLPDAMKEAFAALLEERIAALEPAGPDA